MNGSSESSLAVSAPPGAGPCSLVPLGILHLSFVSYCARVTKRRDFSGGHAEHTAQHSIGVGAKTRHAVSRGTVRLIAEMYGLLYDRDLAKSWMRCLSNDATDPGVFITRCLGQTPDWSAGNPLLGQPL